jgi:hypothetical protein
MSRSRQVKDTAFVRAAISAYVIAFDTGTENKAPDIPYLREMAACRDARKRVQSDSGVFGHAVLIELVSSEDRCVTP